jgi:hypothetical protein
VDKFPMFFAPDAVVTFTFIDPGLGSIDSFMTHLRAYASLFEALAEVRFIYASTRLTHFEAARKAFLALVNRTSRKDPGEEILHYFRLRKLRDMKRYELLSNDDLESLNQYTERFQRHSCQERYPDWRDNQLSNDAVRSEYRDLTPPKQVRFGTVLVDGQAALFEAKPKRHLASQVQVT